MTPAEWQEAMRVATCRVDTREAARRLCDAQLVGLHRAGKRGQPVRIAHAICEGAYRLLHEARDELRRVRALRPEGAIDWVDGMGRVPGLMMTEIEEADEAKGET